MRARAGAPLARGRRGYGYGADGGLVRRAACCSRCRARDDGVERVVEDSEPAATGTEDEGADPRFVRQHGILVFVGAVATEEIPDHRVLREERVDSLLTSEKAGRG